MHLIRLNEGKRPLRGVRWSLHSVSIDSARDWYGTGGTMAVVPSTSGAFVLDCDRGDSSDWPGLADFVAGELGVRPTIKPSTTAGRCHIWVPADELPFGPPLVPFSFSQSAQWAWQSLGGENRHSMGYVRLHTPEYLEWLVEWAGQGTAASMEAINALMLSLGCQPRRGDPPHTSILRLRRGTMGSLNPTIRFSV